MIEFKCPACAKFLKLPQSYAGRPTECPRCRQTVSVPGTAQAAGPAKGPKSSTPALQLCVDCGRSIPASQAMEHSGQTVCTDCYYQRKPIVLKYRSKPTRKRKLARLLLVVLAAAAIAAAVWFWVLR